MRGVAEKADDDVDINLDGISPGPAHMEARKKIIFAGCLRRDPFIHSPEDLSNLAQAESNGLLDL